MIHDFGERRAMRHVEGRLVILLKYHRRSRMPLSRGNDCVSDMLVMVNPRV